MSIDNRELTTDEKIYSTNSQIKKLMAEKVDLKKQKIDGAITRYRTIIKEKMLSGKVEVTDNDIEMLLTNFVYDITNINKI